MPVEEADPRLEPLLFALLEDYERELKLLEPIDPISAVAATDLYREHACIAMIESGNALHRFEGEIDTPQDAHVAIAPAQALDGKQRLSH